MAKLLVEIFRDERRRNSSLLNLTHKHIKNHSNVFHLTHQFEILLLCLLQVIGLQRVSIGQYYRLRACLKKYDATGVPNDVRSTSKTFNPIFYKKIRNVKTEVKMGTYGSLTWARLMFHVQQNRRYRRGVLSQNLLAILTGKTRQRKYARSVRKNYYRKQMFFANVDLDESDPTKKKTLHKLLHHLYFKVMDRRRYRVILFGTVGWESSTRMLSNYMRRRRRGSSVYISLFRRALKTSNSSSGMRDIMNQIWQSNVSSFRSVLTAVLDTKTRSKPTFSMFLV